MRLLTIERRKCIADRFGWSYSTQKRREAAGFPVHRPNGKRRGAVVVAVVSEVEAWLKKVGQSVD